MQLLLVLGIAVAIAAVAFTLQNNASVTVTLGPWSFDSSLAMVLLLSAGTGAVIAVLVSWPGMIKSLWAGSRLRHQVDRLEEEKAALERRVTQLEDELMKLTPEPDPIPEEPPRFLGLKSLFIASETEKPKE